MVHAYHVILPVYGYWLPNDPRGGWSEVIRKWELIHFGNASKTLERRFLEELTPQELRERQAAKKRLKYPAVRLTGTQAAAIGGGFAEKTRKGNYTIWACSILPEHTHLVIARRTFKVEQMVNLLKGSATRRLIDRSLHPLAAHAKEGERPPRMWASHEWKVFLDSEEAIENAIHYVQENPVKEGKREQHWSFVTPFSGLPIGSWVTYHTN
ncbi:transposase [Candidatus Laterigemmans baculatus]|uniref:transposase n=1 Tax=Candidatus Laterigemmans baculatus TaxID=2770505 RepID=UPI0013DA3DF7|nr:transposase [Candidatus Laterigemmans baculatus]